MSGDYEILLQTIIENQEKVLIIQDQINTIEIVVACVLVTLLTYMFISRCMK